MKNQDDVISQGAVNTPVRLVIFKQLLQYSDMLVLPFFYPLDRIVFLMADFCSNL